MIIFPLLTSKSIEFAPGKVVAANVNVSTVPINLLRNFYMEVKRAKEILKEKEQEDPLTQWGFVFPEWNIKKLTKHIIYIEPQKENNTDDIYVVSLVLHPKTQEVQFQKLGTVWGSAGLGVYKFDTLEAFENMVWSFWPLTPTEVFWKCKLIEDNLVRGILLEIRDFEDE